VLLNEFEGIKYADVDKLKLMCYNRLTNSVF
jgi:hypothetical protein